MTTKRRNHGRSKKGRGRSRRVLCDGCGCRPAKDKAIKRFKVRNIVEQAALRDLSEASVYEAYALPKMYAKMQYCVGCAVHHRVVRVRSATDRRIRDPPRRFGARPQARPGQAGGK